MLNKGKGIPSRGNRKWKGSEVGKSLPCSVKASEGGRYGKREEEVKDDIRGVSRGQSLGDLVGIHERLLRRAAAI